MILLIVILILLSPKFLIDRIKHSNNKKDDTEKDDTEKEDTEKEDTENGIKFKPLIAVIVIILIMILIIGISKMSKAI